MTHAESTVAITGASGFIGGALARALVARDRPVRVLLRGDTPPPGLEGPRCTPIQGDLHDADALRALCAGAEVVVHCAAHMGKTDHPKSRRVNVEGTDNLLAAAAAAGVRRFVFVSSISVYRATLRDDRTFTEAIAPYDDPRLNIYSKTKIEGERRAQAFCEAHGMEWVVVRPTNVYGPGCRPWGTDVEQLVRTFHFCYGRIRFNFIHIADVVEGLRLTCDLPAAANGVFNLAAEHVSLADFQNHVARGLGVWTFTAPAPLDAAIRHTIDGINGLRGEVRTTAYTVRSIYPNTHARRVLGFQPRHTLLDAEESAGHVEPANASALTAAVTEARDDAGRWVHPVGSGTSKSACFQTSGRSLGVTHFKHLERLDTHRVRVGAGVQLFDLLAFLRREGLALPTIGEWGGQTVAGAISTGSHGGSYRHGSVCSSVRAVTLIDGRGVERTYGEADPEFPHLLPSFGLLGVITGFELECEPAFSLVVERRATSLNAYLDALEHNPKGHEYRGSIWLPALDCVVDYTAHRGAPPSLPPAAAAAPRENRFHTRAMVLDWMSRKVRAGKGAPSPGSWLAPERLFPPRTFSGHYDEMLAPIRGDAAQILAKRRRNRTPPEAEYALPRARAAALVRELDAHMRSTGHLPDRPIGLRPGAAERGTLAATHGIDSVWVSLFIYPENPLMRFLPDLLVRHGARPHWGKCLFTDTAHLPALYPGWDDFCRLRETLDPEGRFLNAFSARLGIGVAG